MQMGISIEDVEAFWLLRITLANQNSELKKLKVIQNVSNAL